MTATTRRTGFVAVRRMSRLALHAQPLPKKCTATNWRVDAVRIQSVSTAAG
jgi:hypothetical protein